jgi:hypothetical protein
MQGVGPEGIARGAADVERKVNARGGHADEEEKVGTNFCLRFIIFLGVEKR